MDTPSPHSHRNTSSPHFLTDGWRPGSWEAAIIQTEQELNRTRALVERLERLCELLRLKSRSGQPFGR